MRRCVRFAWGLAAALPCAGSLHGAAGHPRPVPQFRDVTERSGIRFHHVRGSREKDYIVETKGGGCAIFDYDNDGREDIFLTNGSTFEMRERRARPGNVLYRNEGNWRFTDVSQAAGVVGGEGDWPIAAAVADIDNDGWLDLLVTGWGPNRLLRNRGDGTFEDISRAAGVDDPGVSAGAVFADMDCDGCLDLYVTTYLVFEREKVPRRGEVRTCHIRGIPILVGPVGLPKAHDIFYHNNGDGTFSDWSERAGFRAVKPGYGLGAIAGDINQDGWPDIYVANDSTANFLFLNNGDGTVRDVAFECGVAFGESGMAQAGMGTDMGDVRGVGWEDLVVANFENDTNTYYANNEGRFFTDDTAVRGLAAASYPYVGWGVLLFDADCDRHLDLMIGNGHVVPQADQVAGNPGYRQPNQLLLNDGAGRFQDVSALAGAGLAVRGATRGTAMADLDGDGDIDIVCNNIDGPPTLLECVGTPVHAWLGVRLRGRNSNRFGVGAWIGLEDEQGRQIRYLRGGRSWGSHSELVARFGMGTAREIRRLMVLWPTGRAESYPATETRRVVTLTEGEGRSAAWTFFASPPAAR